MFTSDNFNKYVEAKELLEQMIAQNARVSFFVQCDTQIARQEELVSLMARAGCFEMFVGVESFNRKTLLAAHKTQNQPSTYSEIVRLCAKYRIVSHFSNIIGFPDDTAGSIRVHLDALREMEPDVASFYILCPIPGTEQYDEFLAKGSITERNLDRFDGTTPTWRHPHLSPQELEDLLFHCYRRFYSAGHVFRTAAKTLYHDWMHGVVPYLGHPIFSRFAAAKRMHPMSGGIGRVLLDSSTDYLDFRTQRFGVREIPLPASLALSDADAELNRRAKAAI
jgi:radical SAM superfamily enzyme YgiQ (UPF0313 family)